MQLRLAAAALALALALTLCASALLADAIVVAGRRTPSPVPFVVDGDEIYAPLLGALRPLDAAVETSAEAVTITTGDGRTIIISRTRPEATRDGVLRELPGPPRSARGSLLVPARAVGSLLGCAVRWEEGSRTLYLHPWVREFRLETLPDRYRVTVRSPAPLSYRATQLDDPPRLVVDLPNTNLAQIPSELRVEDSYLRVARIHQHSLAPEPTGDLTRAVIELEEWRTYRIRESEDRRRLEIEFPLPEAAELPPDVAPVVLTGLSFRRPSPQLAEVVVSVFGEPLCTSVSDEDPTTISVDIAQAHNQLARPELHVADPLVARAAVGPAPEQPGAQRLTIWLREPAQHALVTDRGELRVLLGRFELADLRVVIDAGHGGHDTGAIGRSGLMEKDVNLDIARRVYRRLQAEGVQAILTRRDDNPVRPWTRGNREQHRQELLARCAIANEADAHLFVSIHANARESNPMAYRGTETYYRKEDSAAFARVMQQEVVRATGLRDGGVIRHPRAIVVLYQTNMPAVLVEVAYLSHPEDEALLAGSELRERAAEGIVNGIRRYVLEGGVLAHLARRAGTR